MRRVLYMAHPIKPSPREVNDVLELHGQVRGSAPSPERIKQATQANIHLAGQWLTWLRRSFPETTFIAPYLGSIAAGEDDSDPAQREAGIVDCCAVVERCDGIVMAGRRIGTGGARERDHGVMYAERGSYARVRPWPVFDLTPERIDSFIRRPTWSVIEMGPPFDEWYRWILEHRG